MIKIAALAMGGLVMAFGMSRVDFPAIGEQVARSAADLPGHGVPPMDMAALFRPGQP